MAVYITMLGSVSGRRRRRPTFPVSPSLLGEHRGSRTAAPRGPARGVLKLVSRLPALVAVQVSICWGDAVKHAAPPCGLLHRRRHATGSRAGVSGPPAASPSYHLKPTSDVAPHRGTRVLFWLPSSSRGEGGPDLRCGAPDQPADHASLLRRSATGCAPHRLAWLPLTVKHVLPPPHPPTHWRALPMQARVATPRPCSGQHPPSWWVP